MPSANLEYTLTAVEVAKLAGMCPATVRVYAHRLAKEGKQLGRTFARPGGGWVRLYSEADVAYLKTRTTKRGWPLGKPRKAQADG